ncbi:MAG: 50S ribosomal protein L28 [Oscillatoriales cyanobacterium SM2_2_1]|nr:50S ribosomal protein L28 [Oscillatoriales cyanobacterium SM2_2_1]
MSRRCQLTGKKANNAFSISFSHKRNKRLQHVNLQQKRIWWPEGNRFVSLKLSTRAIKSLEKKGLSQFAKEAGVDLRQF